MAPQTPLRPADDAAGDHAPTAATTPSPTGPPTVPPGTEDRAERGVVSGEHQSWWDKTLVAIFVAVPFAALVAAVPMAWGGFVGWLDIALLVVMYLVTVHGITIGFHRYFTHRSFKAGPALRTALAFTGSMAIEGPLIRWVADHRKHHKYSDADGDPHSPWRYGDSVWGLTKGLWWAQVGWFFDSEQTPAAVYAPDLLKDRTIVRISRGFGFVAAFSLLLPAVLGGLLTWSWQGAATAFFWASLVRVALVHHVTWSINSVCHVWGKRPFKSRDRSGNVAWLALLSGGESWHNLHHAEPTSARHGVLPHQLDTSARLISWFEKAGWATDVRWPSTERLAARRVDPADG